MTGASVSNAAGILPALNETITISSTAPATDAVIEPALHTIDQTSSDAITAQSDPAESAPEAPAPSLAALVESHDDNVADIDSEARCLATAIYYEARSESLAGKLAVARVIVNRSDSGRFPTTICGVVTQPGQFSFVRGHRMPDAPVAASSWPDSVAIARVAIADAWRSQAEGALFFHASRVSPGWDRARLARIDNHIFYR
ncbi:MAG: cell wall hydrolase [Sphingobium sp.]